MALKMPAKPTIVSTSKWRLFNCVVIDNQRNDAFQNKGREQCSEEYIAITFRGIPAVDGKHYLIGQLVFHL
jgi:hypothetical protein